MFVHQLNARVTLDLASVLNDNDDWKLLASEYGFTNIEISHFRTVGQKPGCSPAESMLKGMGMRNCIVDELFLHLFRLRFNQAMHVLQPYVPAKYHHLIGVNPNSSYGPPQSIASRRPAPPPPIPAAARRRHDPSLEENLNYSGEVSAAAAAVTTVQPTPPPPYQHYPTYPVAGAGAVPRSSRQAMPPTDIYKKKILNIDIPEDDDPGDDNQAGGGVGACGFETGIKRVDGGYGHASMPTPPEGSGQLVLRDQQGLKPQYRGPDPSRSSNIPNNHQSSRPRNSPAPGPGHRHSIEPSAAGSSPGSSSIESMIKQRKPSGIKTGSSNEMLLKNIPFQDIKASCNDFKDTNDNVLGQGGFGIVYKGRYNGQDVAVKRILDKRRNAGDETFKKCVDQAITELRCLHTFPAENVLPLMAISFDPTFGHDPCLVYQLMPNGSVSDRLKRHGHWSSSPLLSWRERANIAMGTARGLTHLHANNIFHLDIKSANILLDRHNEPRIGDFGLARSGPDGDVQKTCTLVSLVQGTQAYLPDDYIRNHLLSYAVDTFCFGIFMFELVSGKSPKFKLTHDSDCLRDVMLDSDSLPSDWIDNSIPSSPWIGVLFDIGKSCAVENRKKRPPMQTVLDCLEYLYKHPSSAVALQIMYDEHNKVKNLQQQQQQTLQPSPQPVAAGAGPGISSVMIPAVLDSASKDVSQRSATSTAPNTALGSSTSSSASTVSHSTSEMTNSTLGEDEMSRALTSRVQVMDRSLIKPLHKYLPNPVVEQSIPNLPLLGGQSSSSSAMIPTVLKDSSSSNGHADMSGIPDLSLINLSEATQALSQSLAAAMPALPELPSTQDSQKTEERLRQIDYAAETAAMFDPLGK